DGARQGVSVLVGEEHASVLVLRVDRVREHRALDGDALVRLRVEDDAFWTPRSVFRDPLDAPRGEEDRVVANREVAEVQLAGRQIPRPAAVERERDERSALVVDDVGAFAVDVDVASGARRDVPELVRLARALEALATETVVPASAAMVQIAREHGGVG